MNIKQEYLNSAITTNISLLSNILRGIFLQEMDKLTINNKVRPYDTETIWTIYMHS